MLDIHSAMVTIATPHLDPLLAFYQALLGQFPHPYTPPVYAEFQLPGLRLGLFQSRTSDRLEFAQPGKGSLSLVLTVVDLEAAIGQLHALGYPPPGPIITASHGREVYAYDPMGNRLILYTPTPKN
ncbi:VOC family protein [Trichothermofontia sp.]